MASSLSTKRNFLRATVANAPNDLSHGCKQRIGQWLFKGGASHQLGHFCFGGKSYILIILQTAPATYRRTQWAFLLLLCFPFAKPNEMDNRKQPDQDQNCPRASLTSFTSRLFFFQLWFCCRAARLVTERTKSSTLAVTLPLRCGRTNRHHVETVINRTCRVNSGAAGADKTQTVPSRLTKPQPPPTPFSAFYIIWLLEQQVGSSRLLMKAPIG